MNLDDLRMTSRFRLVNRTSAVAGVVVEPWGMIYVLEPGEPLDLSCEHPADVPFEIEHQPDRIVVWGGPAATASITHRGRVDEHVRTPGRESWPTFRPTGQ